MTALVPETDAHKRSGNPAETGGDATGLYFAMFFALPLLAAPAAGVLAASVIWEQPELAWAATVVGVITGFGYAWVFGAVAARRLQARGPELLLTMRVGPSTAKAGRDDESAKAREPSWLVGLLTTVSMISIFPQGLIPLVQTLFGVEEEVRAWFLPRFLPQPFQMPWAAGFIVLGVLTGWLAITIYRRSTSRATNQL